MLSEHVDQHGTVIADPDDPELTERLGRDDRGELHHQPGARVQAAVAEDVVEREIVEVLHQAA